MNKNLFVRTVIIVGVIPFVYLVAIFAFLFPASLTLKDLYQEMGTNLPSLSAVIFDAFSFVRSYWYIAFPFTFALLLTGSSFLAYFISKSTDGKRYLLVSLGFTCLFIGLIGFAVYLGLYLPMDFISK